MTSVTVRSSSLRPTIARAIACVVLACVLTALNLQTLLTEQTTAQSLMSSSLWQATVQKLDGRMLQTTEQLQVQVPYVSLFVICLPLGMACWIVGAALIARRRRLPFSTALAQWGWYGWLWWFIPIIWEILQLLVFLSGWSSLEALLLLTHPGLWYSLAFAGWVSTFYGLATRPAASEMPLNHSASAARIPWSIWIAVGLYVAVFTAMNWQLYRGLLIPHGDTAMYEEHLWNVTHGKGFRSYLDQGLFLGEHVQVIHLLLIPLHLLWPSHLLLELCESLALASGAIPVFWLAQRHTGSKRAGVFVAIAYLLYFPLQYLDIAIDLKTFRPIGFGVPLMLFALDQMERRRWKTMLLLLLLALSAKEDYAIVIAPLGVWLAVSAFSDKSAPQSAKKNGKGIGIGFGLAAFATGYLFLVTRHVIPWFRDGEEVHYVRYFSKFGGSLGEIAENMLTNPGLLFGELATASTVLYLLAVLLPVGFVALWSPGRLSVGLPLFVLLCLNEITQKEPLPWHHFHAPLVPIIFWAVAAGLGRIAVFRCRRADDLDEDARIKKRQAMANRVACFVCAISLAAGFFSGLSPLARQFWDLGSFFHWRALYVPGERAEMLAEVLEQIPRNSRVASTDFVHPRFTHHDRSYDYSNYRRKASGYKLRVPDDTDYIVIDTQHRYSEIKSPEQIPEYRDQPNRWELLPDVSGGYFIVLKRRRSG